MQKKFPKVELHNQGLAENNYVSDGKIYAASHLVQWCKEKKYPIFDLPLAGIDLNYSPWNDLDNAKNIAIHVKRINKTDLNYPVIIDDRGYIADGWHRVIKALSLGMRSIKAIRIQEMPRPDGYTNKE